MVCCVYSMLSNKLMSHGYVGSVDETVCCVVYMLDKQVS